MTNQYTNTLGGTVKLYCDRTIECAEEIKRIDSSDIESMRPLVAIQLRNARDWLTAIEGIIEREYQLKSP